MPVAISTARLEARISTDLHSMLKRAAELEGRTMTDFVVSAVRDAAQRAIELARQRLGVPPDLALEVGDVAPSPRGPARGAEVQVAIGAAVHRVSRDRARLVAAKGARLAGEQSATGQVSAAHADGPGLSGRIGGFDSGAGIDATDPGTPARQHGRRALRDRRCAR